MQEIRFHGRGGQGTVVASILMAKAFFDAGFNVQTFPVFGVERRGAPVEAYLRLDEKKILIRSNVYTPDHVVVQDAKLLRTVDVTRGLKPGGWILVNSPVKPEHPARIHDFQLAWVDATRIAVANGLGTRTQPMINTAMIGAFARLMGTPSIDAVASVIRNDIPVKPDQNVAAAREAYERLELSGVPDG